MKAQSLVRAAKAAKMKLRTAHNRKDEFWRVVFYTDEGKKRTVYLPRDNFVGTMVKWKLGEARDIELVDYTDHTTSELIECIDPRPWLGVPKVYNRAIPLHHIIYHHTIKK